MKRHVVWAVTAVLGCSQTPSTTSTSATPRLTDGLYARIYTNKGRITGRLEPDLTPLTVANFVGLAEGTIANAAFDVGRPYYDGTVYHRVVAGHVIQAGVPQSDRSRGPGYMFPNEIHAKLSHDHAGAFNMANSGPNTNAAQFCITLGDRSYLDVDYIVFGDVVEGMDVVMSIVQGDRIDSVRIVRVGRKAEAFRPTTESFRVQLAAAQQRATEHAEKKRVAEAAWIRKTYPRVQGSSEGVRTERVAAGTGTLAPMAPRRVKYSGTRVRYVGHVLGRSGPPLEVLTFGSTETGTPALVDAPQVFTFEPGKTRINPGLDTLIAGMAPGEKRVAVVPAALAYGRSGFYAPETPGKQRFIISPHSLVAYEVEVLKD